MKAVEVNGGFRLTTKRTQSDKRLTKPGLEGWVTTINAPSAAASGVEFARCPRGSVDAQAYWPVVYSQYDDNNVLELGPNMDIAVVMMKDGLLLRPGAIAGTLPLHSPPAVQSILATQAIIRQPHKLPSGIAIT